VGGFVLLGLAFGAPAGGRGPGGSVAAGAGLLAGAGAGGGDAVELGADPLDRRLALRGVALGLLGVVADDPPHTRAWRRCGLP
jgi:hypothetical protein